MSSLIALSVGPIQEFISAARRTRDLFAGSTLLSELSKAAARGITNFGGRTIFPSSNCSLAPGSEDLVANIILAVVEDEKKPAEAILAGKQAAMAHWETISKDVFNQVQNENTILADVWNSQVGDVLELYGAWVEMGKTGEKNHTAFQIARNSLMRLLAGRKSLRNFNPCRSFQGIPKSSLDGQRDSVIKDKTLPPKIQRLLRVKKGEQLDSIGVIKRAWQGTNTVFPSVSRIAADSWLRGIAAKSPDLLNTFKNTCEELRNADAIDLPRLNQNTFSRYAMFPLEGSALYSTRHKDLVNDPEDSLILEPLKNGLKCLTGKFKDPDPYVAILIADGDNMGKALGEFKNAEELEKFSANLNEFAKNAKNAVEAHQGTLVYSGGDDVVAILPVDKCIECAATLKDGFQEKLKCSFSNNSLVPTLSVGIGIGHSIEDLEDLLNYARAAEKHAKNPEAGEGKKRNGLAVHVHKRGGGPVKIRDNWSEALDESLLQLANLINEGQLSTRFASELVILARQYKGWPSDNAEAIQLDTLRVLNKKQGGAKNNDTLKTIIESLKDSKGIQRLAEKILVARQIATAKRFSETRHTDDLS